MYHQHDKDQREVQQAKELRLQVTAVLVRPLVGPESRQDAGKRVKLSVRQLAVSPGRLLS